MILYELAGTEDHPAYQAMQVSNVNRQYDFLRAIVLGSIQAKRLILSHTVIQALNYHAIVCLHTNAGEYRPCEVAVGNHRPPAHYRVKALMDDFINEVNRSWELTDPVALAAYALWRLNFIHSFINGNGRTARAVSYFIICLKFGHLLPGDVTLPELIVKNREEYVAALVDADDSLKAGRLDLSVLHALISRLLSEQLGFSQ